MKLSQLSTFDQAMKEFGDVLYGDTPIRDGTKTALNISLGKLTFASKQQRIERDLFSIRMAMRDIAKYVQEIESLKTVWERTLPVFSQTLL